MYRTNIKIKCKPKPYFLIVENRKRNIKLTHLKETDIELFQIFNFLCKDGVDIAHSKKQRINS